MSEIGGALGQPGQAGAGTAAGLGVIQGKRSMAVAAIR
jgi:hypothetical protein